MNSANGNKTYWKSVPADAIIGNNATPSDELFALLAPDATILDVGCGRGVTAAALAAKGYRVTAVDMNECAIEKGRARNDGVTYVVADCTERLPFANDTFDAVMTSFVLVNLTKTERTTCVREMHRVLKPKGYAWINEGMASTAYERRYALARQVLGEERSFYVFKDARAAESVSSETDLARMIESGGIERTAHHFTEEEIRGLLAEDACLGVFPSSTTSPRTGLEIRMATFIFQKP